MNYDISKQELKENWNILIGRYANGILKDKPQPNNLKDAFAQMSAKDRIDLREMFEEDAPKNLQEAIWKTMAMI